MFGNFWTTVMRPLGIIGYRFTRGRANGPPDFALRGSREVQRRIFGMRDIYWLLVILFLWIGVSGYLLWGMYRMDGELDASHRLIERQNKTLHEYADVISDLLLENIALREVLGLNITLEFQEKERETH